MLAVVRLATSGLLSVNLTALVELVAFLLMLWVLARFIYPPIMAIIDERQQRIAAQLAAADRARNATDEQLSAAEASVRQARQQAGQIIEGANRAGERAIQEAQDRAREEARQIVERASREIGTERERAVESIRQQMAGIVSAAVRKIVGANLDGQRGQALIETAIKQAELESRVTS